MNTYKLFLNTILLAGMIACPVVAEEERGNSSPSALVAVAFSNSAKFSIEVEALSELEMEATLGKYSSLMGSINGFDWYLGGRREALRSISFGGRCLSCSPSNIMSY